MATESDPADESGSERSPAGPASGSWARRTLAATGAVLLLSALWATVTGWTGLTGSHPAGWITNLVATVVGAGYLAWAAWHADRTVPGWRRWTARITVTMGTVLLAGTVVYTRPLSAERVALDALDAHADGGEVGISDGTTSLTMWPAEPRRTGLVYYPGAKVDPRAYTRVLLPVAAAGYPVVVVKQPYNLAVLDIDAASRWVGEPDDDVDRWIVGGHSLGGAMAASYASEERPELAGLLLHAAYPPNDMSDRDLIVGAVSGTRDGLATPDDIDDSVVDLPPNTEFTRIDGAIHAYFGDYGHQRNDGEPTIDRDAAQRAIVEATLALVERVEASR